MREALYHSRFGYYTAKIADVGSRGDFSTAATLGDGLARCITSWAMTRASEIRMPHLPLIEVGAGSGDLARNILRRLGWWQRLRTNYVIVETSPVLRERQRAKLRGYRVRWASSMSEALEVSGGSALIFSNEVPDAFPCRVFEKTIAGWRELGVVIGSDGSLSEVLLPRDSDISSLSQFDGLPEGQRVERHDSYREWLSSWSGKWKAGSMLTIDYGSVGRTSYERRPGGTVRAYWKHRLLTGPEVYARFGRQDITADVCFDTLDLWGTELGWKRRSMETMSGFLKRWDPETGKKSDRFTETEEAGDAFMVLEQEPP